MKNNDLPAGVPPARKGKPLLFAGCASKKAEEPKTIEQIQAEQGIPVTVLSVKKGSIRSFEESSGTLQGKQETVLANGVGGTLAKVHVEVGQNISAGTTVASMKMDYGSPVDPASSGYDYAKQAYDRAVKLHAEGAVSKEQVEGAKAMYEGAKLQLGQAKVLINVSAPFSGTVLEIFQSEGSKIAEKTPIVKIADLSGIKVDMQVNESSAPLFAKGQKAFVEMGTDTVWGTIDRTALSANGMTHSFRITATFPNEKKLLKPGMFKNVGVITNEKTGVVTVPFETISFGDKNSVWVVNGGKAEKREVVLGVRNGTEYEIVSGLAEGDQVILSGTTLLSEGSKVLVTK